MLRVAKMFLPTFDITLEREGKNINVPAANLAFLCILSPQLTIVV